MTTADTSFANLSTS